MENNYAQIISEAKYQLLNILNKHFNSLQREIRLMAGGINLLGRAGNSIESSSLPGFAFEEIMTAKLVEETKNNDGNEQIKIVKQWNSNNNSSYDVYGMYKGILVLINLKAEKEGSINNSISSVNQLYADYSYDENREKCFIVLKVKYSVGESKEDGERVLLVNKISAYALEEIDFSNGFSFNKGNKRLNVSPSFIKKNYLPEHLISYSRFKFQLENIINSK